VRVFTRRRQDVTILEQKGTEVRINTLNLVRFWREKIVGGPPYRGGNPCRQFGLSQQQFWVYSPISINQGWFPKGKNTTTLQVTVLTVQKLHLSPHQEAKANTLPPLSACLTLA